MKGKRVRWLSGVLVALLAGPGWMGSAARAETPYEEHMLGLQPAAIHVESIQMSYSLSGGQYTVRAWVRIMDQGSVPVQGATVTVQWTLPSGAHKVQSAVTNATGTARVKVGSGLEGTYQLCVTNVTLTGWVYDPGQNRETCDAVTCPPPSNDPPYTPADPSPADGAIDQSDYVKLTWSGGDPDGDAVTYDVYLWTANSPPEVLVCDDTSDVSCDPGVLRCSTRYEWQVVATDSHGATETGPVWTFSTQGPMPIAVTPGHVYSGSPDNGMVILTFADSHDGAYAVAYPAIRARGMRAMAYVNVLPIVEAWPRGLSGCHTDELDAAGWDVASHGYSHVDPTQLSPEELTAHLRDAQLWLLGRGYTQGPRHYGPPSGQCDQRVLDAALLYYDTVLDGPFGHLPPGYEFKWQRCDNNVAWEMIQSRFDALAGQPSRVLLCSFHDVVVENPSSGQADLARVTAILDYLTSHAINVVTMSDLLDGALATRSSSPLCPQGRPR